VQSGQPKFALLVELAKQTTSEKRRELLREVSDVFVNAGGASNENEAALYDEVLTSLAATMQEEVLRDLSERFASVENAPRRLVATLIDHASFEIGRPLLERSPLISEDKLLEVVQTRSQNHIAVVASRPDVSERLSDAIVTHGDDRALTSLLKNDQARISREAFETVVDRARESRILHEPMVQCASMPVDLLNEMLFIVEQRLRVEILARNEAINPAELDEALSRTKSRMKVATQPSDRDIRRAQHFVAQKKDSGELNATLLIALYRDRQLIHFLFGLAEVTGMDYETTRAIVGRRDIDALATACRAADMERAAFVTIAVLVCGGDKAMGKASIYGDLFSAVPVEAAQRAMRFWKLRTVTDSQAA
jgi:uncharacterized protein (DUF2336 family)